MSDVFDLVKTILGEVTLLYINLLLTWIDSEVVTIISTYILCQVLIYFTYVTSFLSVWFIVGFTFERYIAICFPLKRTSLCSVKREK
ncbi:hypothetical protein MAR_034763 [Mya arenaria]|uniref:G-protein coupled receptors family 1 profile domain-containing protein n=1 Tax=Mya arenaria TaxID=6604 RepID=A0ABY7EL43_MYAAR|nr:hypothetical protein MAR_034763 [Mya arenaria]